MSLASLLRQSTTLYNRSGYDRYGKETVGAGTTIKARVQIVSKPRIMPDGTSYVITAIIYYPSDTTINEGDKITYGANNYRVHGISLPTDGVGQTNHKKIECTNWNI
jgi:plastocyanin